MLGIYNFILLGWFFFFFINYNDVFQFYIFRKFVMYVIDNDMYCYKYVLVNLIDFYREIDF